LRSIFAAVASPEEEDAAAATTAASGGSGDDGGGVRRRRREVDEEKQWPRASCEDKSPRGSFVFCALRAGAMYVKVLFLKTYVMIKYDT
jgi:hypothetical protein